MPFLHRAISGTVFLLVALPLIAADAQAQKRNPYYELQCSLAGAYCDRIYETTPPRTETFDELKQRKARERAQRELERQQQELERQQRQAEQEAQRQAQREQERRAREERERQGTLAAERQREQHRQLLAQRVASAPAVVRWFRTAWPTPQYVIAALFLGFGTISYIGARTSTGPPDVIYLGAGLLSLMFLFVTNQAALFASPVFTLFAALTPLILFVVCNVLHFIRGWHYLFVSHPATSVAMPPLRHGALFPNQELGASLRPDPAQLFDHPPAYQSQNLTEKARALREKIDADADIAAAAMRRDRARAAKLEADAELREARRKLPWWKRWLWW